MSNLITISNLSKTYADGYQALKNINLNIRKGEILALLGPNGAGKTTLISIICGIVTPSTGKIEVNGFDIITDFRKTRSHKLASYLRNLPLMHSKVCLIPSLLAVDYLAKNPILLILKIYLKNYLCGKKKIKR